jgi:hypothetical protein
MGCEEKISFGKPSRRWTDINMNIKELYEDVG